MKIILSRKGFDSTAGGYPNPILPDGTLLSFPIPTKENSGCRYSDITYASKSYSDYLNDLTPGFKGEYCHLDPDIREGTRVVPEWMPAFGQTDSAQGVLRNAGVEAGDMFLFFGRFKETELKKNGRLSFIRGAPIRHIIFGYLQIAEILTNYEDIKKYKWHPHAQKNWRDKNKNALYIPTKNLSFKSEIAGCGVFNYDNKYVLTKPGCSTATWEVRSFYMPDYIYGNRKNSTKDEGLYYAGQWQELILRESLEANAWLNSLF